MPPTPATPKLAAAKAGSSTPKGSGSDRKKLDSNRGSATPKGSKGPKTSARKSTPKGSASDAPAAAATSPAPATDAPPAEPAPEEPAAAEGATGDVVAAPPAAEPAAEAPVDVTDAAAADAAPAAEEAAADDGAAAAAAAAAAEAEAKAAAEAKAKAEAEAKAKAEAEAKAKAEAEAKAKAEAEAKAAEEKELAAAAEAEAKEAASPKERTSNASPSPPGSPSKEVDSLMAELPASFTGLAPSTRDVLEALIFHAYALSKKGVNEMDMEIATLAVSNPNELANVMGAVGDKAKKDALKTSFGKLPSAMRDVKKELIALAQQDSMPLMKVVKADPLEVGSVEPKHAEALAAQALCKGVPLPLGANEPWRWDERWEPVLSLGEQVEGFAKGLYKAAEGKGNAVLNLRARMTGTRKIALRTAGLLIPQAATVDLRDNRLLDDEMAPLATLLETSTKLSKLIVAGNRLTAKGVVQLAEAVAKVESRINELDLSRNRLSDAADGVDFAPVGALNMKVAIMVMSGGKLSDGVGVKLCEAFKAPAAGQKTMLTKLDLSRNNLGVAFADGLSKILAACPTLATLDLSRNDFGLQGAKAIAESLASSQSLKTLDLTAINLCNCTPLKPTPSHPEWSGAAVQKLAESIMEASVGELILSSNGLCGMWAETICGEVVTRGNYTSAAIDTLLTMFDKERISIKREGLKFEDGNFVRASDTEKLYAAVKNNSTKAQKKESTNLAANLVKDMDTDDKGKGGGGDAPGSPEKKPEEPDTEAIALDEIVLPGASNLAKMKAMKKRAAGEQAEVSILKEMGQNQAAEEEAGTEVESAAAANWRLQRDAELKAEEAHEDTKIKAEKRALEAATKKKQEDDLAILQAGHEAPKKGEKPTLKKSNTKKDVKAGGDGPKKSSEPKSTGSGLTPRSSKNSGSGGTGLTPRTNKSDGPGGSADDGKPAAAAKETKSGYGQQTGKGKKKKVVEQVVEEAPNPFANAPLMISMSNLVARTEVSVTSPLVPSGAKVAAGALMRVAQTEEIRDNSRGKMQVEHRMYVALDGDTEALGWVTGISKDEVEHLKLASAGFPLMQCSKVLNCREGKENDSKKLDDVPKHSLVRVMENATMPDGTEKCLICPNSAVADPIGWVVSRKEGSDAPNLVEAPKLTITFDLKTHTAQSLAKALSRPKEGPKRKKDSGGLPFQMAGRRPITRPEDGPSASRHRLVDKPASSLLIFNCSAAQFEVLSWTGDTPFEKLSGEQSFDLISKSSRKRLGRVKIAGELGQPFLDRVEFPDDWLIASDHGVIHDGWQGNGIIDLELTWNKAVATIRVWPWLAYGCSVGARFLIRKQGSAEGQCATVQRILGDDRCVARVDGYSKADGVKGETIVDLQPSTVVRTTSVGYKRDEKVLVLHNNKLVDGQILAWLGSNEFVEGSRHMVNIKPQGDKTGAHAWYDLNMYNHVQTDSEMSAEVFETTRQKYCAALTATEDKVEDAITGNHLQIKDQLIFMDAQNVINGCNPPDYMAVSEVPVMINLLLNASPKRANGTHVAQPVLCRAGPGTGKTWMVKQSLFLLAEKLSSDEPGDGVRLVPVVVYVQRIVRLLNELGDDPSELLSDPNGLMRWYISNQFADKKEEKNMLLQAYEMRAVCILVDGVDEAAGMRELVEAFVHYELVTSGNRLVVTSRPEGVDLDDYKSRFVVMNLKELSQEQQRNVIQMQLQGNAFFEHLVNIAECRKELDAAYSILFKSEALRNDIEDIAFNPHEAAQVEEEKRKEEEEAERARLEAEAEENEHDEKAEKKKKEEEAAAAAEMNRRGSVVGGPEGKDAEKLQQIQPMVRRRLALDTQQDLQVWLSGINIKERLRSAFLENINSMMVKTTKAYSSLLDQLDTEIRLLPSPCTRAALETAIATLEQAQPNKTFDKDLHESLIQLGLQRKLPVSGGRRGAKAAPIPALGLWYQVLQHTDEKYLQMERYRPVLMYILGTLAAATGIREFALQVDDATGRPIPGTEKSQPELKFRDPVDLWLHSTYAGATEPSERPPDAYVCSAVMKCETGEQCLQLMRKLVSGLELEVGAEAAYFTMLELKNSFSSDKYQPTHLRNASCHMLLTFRGLSVAVNVQVEHQELIRTFVTQNYTVHNEYFWHRMLNLSEEAYETKFELLLIFLVEAIGVPVLLSLLLLTYSNSTGGDVIDLDDLPEGRLQLYKLGIMSGIKKRLLITLQAAASVSSGANEDKKGAAEEEAAAAENRPKRERRKGALEQSLGASAGPATGGGPTTEVKVTKHATNEPVLDLNSILRGKKVRVVTGADDVAEAYSLVVRVLDKSRQQGFDLRSGIVAVVPKSHTMHAIVTALVEYVLAPLAMTESSLFEIGKKMLRHVAVDNQENGRREFTSKNVACALGASPEELGLWSRLDLDYDHGVALAATLAKQSDKAPAQYQFKHLSFQEGLYAEHLLLLVTSLTPPNGNGWPGWASDKTASEFLNNRYMNNTCRIAAGHLGALLAKQRPDWDFRQNPLTPNGRMALWYVTDDNDQVHVINVAQNDVGSDDVPGISKTITTCSNLQKLDLSDNELHKLTAVPSEWAMLCDALGNNTTLTDLNLNNNKLGPMGVRTACRALRGTIALQRLGFSFNEPGTEHALADLLRVHPALTTIELVEALDRHLPSRSKDDIGRALMDNKAKTLGFLHCDTFVLAEDTTSLVWPKEASTSDAVLLAGVLVTNTSLTTFNIASGAVLANTARSALGEALLNNPGSRVAFCNDFGLQPKVDTCEFDLSKTELKDVEPFRLLAGCLRGNRTLTHVTLRQLRMEQIETLALALRGNSTLAQLDIIHTTRLGGESIVRLPVPELNGAKVQAGNRGRVDMSQTCIEGAIGRVACAMIGTLTTANTQLECLDLSNTGLGLAIGTEGEGGHIVFRPMCESKSCPLNTLILNNIQLNDKAGAKLFSSLAAGLGKGDAGYEKITSLSVANNDLGKGSAAALKQLLWGERAPCNLKSLDLSGNVGLDGYDTALSIKRNESLTSVDFRNIPSANTEEIYSFLGSFLLQEECQCRLGLLSCDAFQVSSGQAELVLLPPKDEAPSEGAPDGGPVPTKAGVMSLLAGVLKFNSSLKEVKLAGVGLDDASGAFIATALFENKTLETLDVSGNPIGATGITDIARAVRDHPALKALKVDGSELPISQLRGAKGAEGNIDFTDVGIGSLSGHAIGTIVMHNRTLLNLNLKSNKLGADGVQAVVCGLGDAPLKALDVTRNGLSGNAAEIKDLSESICRNLGAIVDLRMDENDLDCPAVSLSPLCKLRSLRVLSWEKNRLTEVPPLIGTMLSLRKLLLHSNQIMELPASICLLTLLETLDVHKNLITTLPNGIGNMKALQKLDLSENKLAELPVTICELNDDLQLSVGRNPLEKPSVEQARQGIGAIRRFFGFNRGKAAEGEGEEKVPPSKPLEGSNIDIERPKRGEDASSRHDWAGPGGTVVLFNCYGCAVREVEGGSDLNTIPGDDTVELVSSFNLQVIGRVKEASNPGQPIGQRVELYNEWLPWKNQEIESHEVANLLINVRWKVLGSGKNSATLLVNPWLAYGCTVGSRIRTETGFATITAIKDDDSCEALRDNVKEGTRADRMDPRPDTVGRTTLPTFKAGQKLLLLHDGVPVDAVVDEWLGIRRGSRHRIRLTAAKAPAATGAAPSSPSKGKEMLEVDLNETNHAKLLFPTVARYEDARAQYCEKLLAGKHTTVRDEATQKDLKVGDQRIFVKPFRYIQPEAAPAAEPAADAKKGGDDDDDEEEKVVEKPKAYEELGTDDQVSSLTSILNNIILPITSRNAKMAPTLVRTKTSPEHALVVNQAMFMLATELREPHPRLGPIKLVPITLSMARVAELQSTDEALYKQGARAVIAKAFELDYPGAGDMLRQAMDMKALIVVAEVTSEAEFALFKDAMLEELKTHRLIIMATGFNADNEPLQVPLSLAEQWSLHLLSTMGLFMNELKISDKMLSLLFTRIKASSSDGSIYGKVTKLHLASSEVGRNAMTALQELLRSTDCMINSLDLSFTQVDGWALVQSMKSNSSLTALDLMNVPKIEIMYESISTLLNDAATKCPLGYLRCEAFDLHEGLTTLNLREEPIAPIAVRLLAALLKNNKKLSELDLTACDVEKEAATALAEALPKNSSLMTLRLGFNVVLDDGSKKTIADACSTREPPVHLEM